MVDTTCAYCVFKIMNSDNTTQIDCKLDRIDKFRKTGAKIKLSKNNPYFLIKDRVCQALRTSFWLEQIKELPEIAVRKEITIQCGIIVLALQHTLEEIKNTILSAMNQKNVKPTVVLVALNSDSVHPAKAVKLMQDICIDSVVWKVKDFNNNPDMDRLQMIDISVEPLDGSYYAVFSAGYIIPDNYLYKIDCAINDDLKRFCLLKPDAEGNGMFVQRRLHDYVHGNEKTVLEYYDDNSMLIGNDITEKAEHLALADNMQHMIQNVGDIICKS